LTAVLLPPVPLLIGMAIFAAAADARVRVLVQCAG
jgi:hypothetical protein